MRPVDPDLAELQERLERERAELRRLEDLAGTAALADVLRHTRIQIAVLEEQVGARRRLLASMEDRRSQSEADLRKREVAASEIGATGMRWSVKVATLGTIIGALALYVAWRSSDAARDQAEVARKALAISVMQDRAAEETELHRIREAILSPSPGLAPWTTWNGFAAEHAEKLLRLLDPGNLFMESEASSLGVRLDRSIPSSEATAAACDKKVQTLAQAGRLTRAGRFSADSLSTALRGPTAAFLIESLPRCLAATESKPGNRALFLASYYFSTSVRSDRKYSDPRAALSTPLPDGFDHLLTTLSLGTDIRRPAPYAPTAEDITNAVFGFGGCDGSIRDASILGDLNRPGTGGVKLSFTPQWSNGPGADRPCFEWRPPVSGGRMALGFSAAGDTVLSVDIPGLGAFEARVPTRTGRYTPRRPVPIEAAWNLGALTPAASLRLVVDGEVAQVTVSDKVLFHAQ